ncbi:MAG TPA: glycosyltransferase, partial [Acidimicrobiia bacterium]|nr:glycosyltransferase [Acidimicrobiia bacterium]
LLQGVEGDVNVLQVARDISLTRAWNRGIDAARGAVVCVVAPGTKFRPGWIAGLEKALAEAPGIGAVGPRVVTPGGMVAEFGRRVHTSGGDAGPVVSARFVGVDAELETPSRDVDAVVPPVVAIRTAAWAECGGLDALLPVEDAFVDLGLRLNVRGWRVVASGDLDVVTANETRAPARRRLSSPLVERWNARVSRRATRGQVSRAASARSRGLNVVGYFTSTFGLGEASRLLLDALVDAGIPVSALNVSFPSLEGDAFPWDPPCPQDVRYETTLMCITPRETAGIKEQMPAQELIARGRTIGYWFWETARFPDMHHHAFAHVDEVWAGSAFTQRAIQKVAPVPVHAVPPPVPEAVAPTHSRADVGLPDRFSFLFMFDYPSLITRKNALGLVEAFVRAFEPGEGPALVVKATNGDRHQRERDALRRAAAAHPDVILIEERLPSEANRDLIALCDSYVSLHRAEGFGLTMAEAMAHGKPVIATEFSGNLDFMSHENSFLVPARTVVTEHPVLGGVVEWGDPDLDAAAAALRTVFGDREEAAARGARARDDLRRYHSVEARGRLIAEILDLGGHVRSGTTEARTGRQAT